MLPIVPALLGSIYLLFIALNFSGRTKVKSIGHVQLDASTIRFRSQSHGHWDLPLSNLQILGESTTPHGTLADDYFLCFATDSQNWIELPMDTEGTTQLLQDLSAALGGISSLRLSNSTDFTSQILWPLPLAGKPMFNYTTLPSKTLLGRILKLTRNQQAYSDQAAEILTANAHP